MKRAQPARWIVVALATVAGTSLADVNGVGRGTVPTQSREPALDQSQVPGECRRYLTAPSDSTSDSVAWEQRLSLASCRQELAIAPVSNPEKFPALVASIQRAMAPSIEIYRDAMARGPGQIQILAAYGLGMTHVNTIVRARNAIRVVDAGAFGGAAYGASAQRDRYMVLHGALEPLLAGERDAAIAAFREVARLAAEDPAAARANPVMPVVIASAANLITLLR
jgi:hypothetical protein